MYCKMALQVWRHGCSLISRLKELEIENKRLKKMYSNAQVDAEILKEAFAKKW